MSPRRLAALLIAAAALTAAGIAARAAAPRGADRPSAGGSLAAVEQPPAHPLAGSTPAETRATPTVPAKAAYATTLPDSAGRAIAEHWCLLCHSAMLITQQAKDSTAWEKTLAQMESWGVVVTPEEHDTLRTYLTRCFGPRLKPLPARPAPSPTAAGDTTRAPSTPR